MSASSLLLAKLDAVMQTGPGRWRARCPAHGSKGRTLGIREAEDGRVLLHCFGGCEAAAVLGAVGLDMNALFPERLHNANRESGAHIALSRIFEAADVFAALHNELFHVQVCAATMAKGKPLAPESHERLRRAASRIHDALDAARPTVYRRTNR